MNILYNYLKKLGINSTDELNETERAQYEQWKQALNGRKLTDEDVGEFLESMRKKCIEKFRDITKLSEKEQMYYSMQLDLIENIQGFLMTPEIEKAMTQKQLENMVNL